MTAPAADLAWGPHGDMFFLPLPKAEPLMLAAARCSDDGSCPSLATTARRAAYAARIDPEVADYLRRRVAAKTCRCAHEALHARLMRGEGMPR